MSVIICGRKYRISWFQRMFLNGRESHFFCDDQKATLKVSESMTAKQAFIAGVEISEAIHGDAIESIVSPKLTVSARS